MSGSMAGSISLLSPVNLYSAILLIVTLLICGSIGDKLEEEHGVKYADRCEACKILAIELQASLTKTGRSHDVLEVG